MIPGDLHGAAITNQTTFLCINTNTQGAPTYAVVSPNFCYELCRDYYRNLGLEYFFFQIYNNGTHEVCGCCDDCDTTTPGPPNSEVFHVTEPTFPPSPAPTPAPTPVSSWSMMLRCAS